MIEPHCYVAVGAEARWTNWRGERVMQVHGEYRASSGRLIGTCYEFVTSSGSEDVAAVRVE